MVKGINKQVIVVQSPDPELFEQAIFILREDAAVKRGVSDRDLLRQARQAAWDYLKKEPTSRAAPHWWAAVGAGITGLVWAACSILSIL